nr:CTP synthase [Sulfurospirillum sp.]
IETQDAQTIYQVPLSLQRENILAPIADMLNLDELNPNMEAWDTLVKRVIAPTNELTVGFVGKYLNLKEAYKSLTESFIHVGAHLNTRVKIKWIDSEELEEKEAKDFLSGVDCILVAGGFGYRGVEGKIKAIQFARENKVPFLGICLGMQLSMIEYARNVLHIKSANSIEFDTKTASPIIYLIDSFLSATGNKQVRTFESPLGGTMRLGGYECTTKENSLLRRVYDGKKKIKERHRHRYEANPIYRKEFEKAGMIISGESDGLIEAIELKEHPFFLGVQFHPEFTSRLTNPNRVLLSFCEVALRLNKNA